MLVSASPKREREDPSSLGALAEIAVAAAKFLCHQNIGRRAERNQTSGQESASLVADGPFIFQVFRWLLRIFDIFQFFTHLRRSFVPHSVLWCSEVSLVLLDRL